MYSASSGNPGRVLISGVGVAGPALGFWLARAGWSATLVEAAPALRTGGYIVDFWGPGFEVAERMGLSARLREIGYRIDALKIMNGDGRLITKLGVAAIADIMGDRYVSLLRGDLSAELFARARDRVESRFGQEVTRLTDTGEWVEVEFNDGSQECFDLVIGADGLHSAIRRLAFADDADCEVPLGYYVAAFTAPGYPHREAKAYVSRTIPGRQVARYTLRDGRATLFMILSSDLAKGRPLDSAEQQQALLAEVFAPVKWEATDIIRALDHAEDFYFDSVSQVRAPRWSRGRVALVGDAAHCPSLLAGEGSSLAMAGAYILAGELVQAGGDHAAAFARYEGRLRAFIERRQRSAVKMAGWFVPRTELGLFTRNQITRLAGLPVFSKLIAGPMVDNSLPLPDYDWPVRA